MILTSWWRKALLAAATATLFALAAILHYLGHGLPSLIALLWAIGAGGLMLALVVKRVGDALTQSRTTTRLMQQVQRSSADHGTASLDLLQSVRTDVNSLSGQLELATHAVKEGAAQNERMLQALRRRLDEAAIDPVRRTGQDGGASDGRSIDQVQSDTLQEIEALLRLRDEYPLQFESPLLWNFALSPRGMWQVINLVREQAPSTIVELGSGLSTLYLSRAVTNSAGSAIYSLEHEFEYLEATRQVLEMHGATERVELIHAPLVDTDVGGRTFSWYQVSDRLPAKIDLLLVDGPPGASGPLARLPALECLLDRLQPGAVIVLDDAHREDEREIARSWIRDFDLHRRHSLTPRQMILERPVLA